jgi:hypothetical protein
MIPEFGARTNIRGELEEVKEVKEVKDRKGPNCVVDPFEQRWELVT